MATDNHNVDGPDESPNGFSDSERRSGGRRLNRVPLFIGAGLLALFAIGVLYTIKVKNDQQKETAAVQEQGNKPEPGNAEPVFGSAPEYGHIEGKQGTDSKQSPPSNPPANSNQNTDGQNAGMPAGNDRYKREWDAYYQQKQKIEQDRLEDERKAVKNSTAVQSGGDFETASNGDQQGSEQNALNQLQSQASALRQKQQQLSALANSGGAGAGMDGMDMSGGMGGGDQNRQQQKQAWFQNANQKSSDGHYLNNTREAPLSDTELQAGTVIPGTMISGINSDIPGMIIGQVREPVYSSSNVNSKKILIPQGAKLIGTYDNGVTMGQERVMIAWNRIIYPDGTSLDLQGMPGTDQGGYSGFADKVNNHYLRTFGNAAFLSLFSAGVQLSQPQSTNGENYSSSQIMAASLGQQMGQLGQEYARKGLNIAPTIEIRPGYNFNIMVSKDIILPEWDGE